MWQVSSPSLLSFLHTETFPQPSALRYNRRTMARCSTNHSAASLATPKADVHARSLARCTQSARRKPALGELHPSSCMICATPPAPPPSHHHHLLLHPPIRIHSHCNPPCCRYHHFSRRHILFPASHQSLSKTATPIIARLPSLHPLCSPCCQALSRSQTTVLRVPSANNH